MLFAEIFFPSHALIVAYSLYLVGLAVAILVALIVHKTSKDGEEEPLLIELPEYKTPNARTVAIYVWDKVKDYLSKAGTVIFVASIVLWFVLNTGLSGFTDDVSQSFAAMVGRILVPVLSPAGLGHWQIGVALISGLSAKEVVVSSFAVLFGISNINSPDGMSALGSALGMMGFGPVNAYALMISACSILLYGGGGYHSPGDRLLEMDHPERGIPDSGGLDGSCAGVPDRKPAVGAAGSGSPRSEQNRKPVLRPAG